jgi:HK97 family phage major capsid protein
MKSIADQIKDLENTRAAKAARMEEVTVKSIEEGRSLEADEAEEFDALETEIKQIDQDLVRFNTLQKMQAQKAAAVTPAAGLSAKSASNVRGGMVLVKNTEKEDVFAGQSFTRKTIAKILAKKEGVSAWEMAHMLYGKTNPTLVAVMKTAVPGLAGGTGEEGAELVTADTRYNGDFVNYLYSQTVYNKLPLRQVPANVTIKGQDGAATGYWVGESKGIPMSKSSFNTVTLRYKKVGALTTISNELLKYSSPDAEMLIRDALVEAAAQRIDTTFVSNSVGVADTTPAGIMYNIAGTTSAGTDGDGVINDIKELKQRFITAKNMGGLYWVMNPGLASSIGLLRNALDQREFPGVTETGGTLEGYPVVTGDNVNAAHLILVKPTDIYRIGMGGVQVSMSEHATIEQSDTPAGAQDTPVALANTPVSMFQTESTAVKVVVDIDFARRRESAVAWISNASYGAAIST